MDGTEQRYQRHFKNGIALVQRCLTPSYVQKIVSFAARAFAPVLWRSWAYRTERQRFRRAGCGGAGACRPAPRRAAIGRGPAPSADWVWRTCEAYPPPPGRAADGERFISEQPSLTAPFELRTPTSARTRLSRLEHD
ncbi:hypothetical protein HF086_004950 [Spodoptera exigua]|uniref:Uncharacterized protein n=1 Tax=Spodoptera exigua TaxID=7107 RepID=A0A922S900_SPOEX|nr:hypothetical protein HF086_004950 [Spodoptera exigua]